MLEERVALAVLAVTGWFLSASHALETPEFTREQEFRTRDGAFVVRSGSGGMFIVSVSNRTIAIKSATLEPCSTPIDPFEDAIEGELRARYFEPLEKMIIWGVRGEESIRASESRTVYYAMLLVDPMKCQSTAVWLPDDRVASSRPLFLPEVLPPYPSSDGFNVYFASQQHCSPCSFDGSGSRLKDRDPLEAEEAEPTGPVHLLWLNPVEDSFVGYFYALNFANRTAVVKLLDERHRVRRFRYLENPVDVVSVRNGRIRNVGYCYQLRDSSDNKLHCERLDSRLKAVVSVTVPLEQSARKVSLEYDAQGNFFVGVVLPSGVRVLVYDIVGALLATLDFGQLQDSQSVRDLAAYFQDNNQYCFFYSIEQQNSRANDANNIVKCIDTRKYIRNPV